jgi:hypothetical protein
MGMDENMNLDSVFDEHHHIFGAQKSIKNEEQWKYMESHGCPGNNVIVSASYR